MRDQNHRALRTEWSDRKYTGDPTIRRKKLCLAELEVSEATPQLDSLSCANGE
jgi:hypothetical protein